MVEYNHRQQAILLFALCLLSLSNLAACANPQPPPPDPTPTAATTAILESTAQPTPAPPSPTSKAIQPTTTASPSPAPPTTAATAINTAAPIQSSFVTIASPLSSGSVTAVALSHNGRLAAVIQDTKLFLYDASNEETLRIGPPSGHVFAASLSPDGATVAYWATTAAADDIPSEAECRNPDSPVCAALFVYDVAAGATVAVPFGIPVGGLDTPTLSVAVADNGLVAAGGDGLIRSGTFLIDSRTAAEPTQVSAETGAVSLTRDGRYLAYLTPSGAFVYDTQDTTTTAATTDWPESNPAHELAAPQIDVSDDGRYLVLASSANLTGGPPTPCIHLPDQELPFCRHVYLIDSHEKRVELISLSDGGQPANGVSWRAAISGDGRFVLFDSFADNLSDASVCPEQFTRCPQVYLRDREQGRTILLSRAMDGEAANDGSFAADLSADGAYAAIISGATNLSTAATPEPFYTRKGYLVDVGFVLELDSR